MLRLIFTNLITLEKTIIFHTMRRIVLVLLLVVRLCNCGNVQPLGYLKKDLQSAGTLTVEPSCTPPFIMMKCMVKRANQSFWVNLHSSFFDLSFCHSKPLFFCTSVGMWSHTGHNTHALFPRLELKSLAVLSFCSLSFVPCCWFFLFYLFFHQYVVTNYPAASCCTARHLSSSLTKPRLQSI